MTITSDDVISLADVVITIKLVDKPFRRTFWIRNDLDDWYIRDVVSAQIHGELVRRDDRGPLQVIVKHRPAEIASARISPSARKRSLGEKVAVPREKVSTARQTRQAASGSNHRSCFKLTAPPVDRGPCAPSAVTANRRHPREIPPWKAFPATPNTEPNHPLPEAPEGRHSKHDHHRQAADRGLPRNGDSLGRDDCAALVDELAEIGDDGLVGLGCLGKIRQPIDWRHGQIVRNSVFKKRRDHARDRLASPGQFHGQ
jgi:hypothetical protein